MAWNLKSGSYPRVEVAWVTWDLKSGVYRHVSVTWVAWNLMCGDALEVALILMCECIFSCKKKLYKRLCPSVHWSVRPSVGQAFLENR